MHQVSQLTTVKSQDVNVPVQVVYQLGLLLLYGVYHNAEITSSQELKVPVQVVYQHQLASWQLSVGISQHCAIQLS